MTDYVYECGCGQKTRISEYQIGMETSCPQCKADVKYTPSNVKELTPAIAPPPREKTALEAAHEENPNEALHAPLQPFDPNKPPHEIDEDHCARCGREFRGEWDQHPTVTGTLCNICSNMMAADGLGTIGNPTESARKSPLSNIDDSVDPFTAQPKPEEVSAPRGPWFIEMYPTESKIVLGFLAACVIIMAIWASNQETPSSLDPPDRSEQAEVMQDRLAELPWGVLVGIRIVFRGLMLVLPSFLYLRAIHKDNYDNAVASFLEMCMFFVPISFLTALPYPAVVASGALALILALFTLHNHYDLRPGQIVTWFIFFVVSGLLLGSAELMVMGLIANALV